jgi:hypothetical protein
VDHFGATLCAFLLFLQVDVEINIVLVGKIDLAMSGMCPGCERPHDFIYVRDVDIVFDQQNLGAPKPAFPAKTMSAGCPTLREFGMLGNLADNSPRSFDNNFSTPACAIIFGRFGLNVFLLGFLSNIGQEGFA